MNDRDAYIEYIIEKLKECTDIGLLDLILRLLSQK